MTVSARDTISNSMMEEEEQENDEQAALLSGVIADSVLGVRTDTVDNGDAKLSGTHQHRTDV